MDTARLSGGRRWPAKSSSSIGTRSGTSQAWLAGLPCRVLRLDGTRPLPDLVKEVCAAIKG